VSKPKFRPDPEAPAAVPTGLTAAYFTDRELDTLRTVCRDADNELAKRHLETALSRALSAALPARPVDGMAG
jgi:hypothetical protein